MFCRLVSLVPGGRHASRGQGSSWDCRQHSGAAMNASTNLPFAPRPKAPRQPMLWAAVSYSAGILTGVYVWRPPLLWVLGGSCFIFAAAYFAIRRSRLGWAIALAALFVAGALHVQVRGGDTHLDTSILSYADGRELQITGHVIRDGRIQPGAIGEVRQTVEVQAEEIRTESGQEIPLHSGIRVGVYAPSGRPMSAF